jgi:CDP-diacylglycerol--serine O-phosphatidyltransferase
MLPLIFFLAFPELGQLPAPVIAGWMVGGGLLMVSELPTYSFKRIKVPRRFLLPTMALVGLAVAGLAGQPWVTLFVVLAVYMATFPVSYRTYKRLREEAERLQDDEDDDDGDTPDSEDQSGPVPLRPVN